MAESTQTQAITGIDVLPETELEDGCCETPYIVPCQAGIASWTGAARSF
jgi:hypothetical protein